jgi:hypothetical protein
VVPGTATQIGAAFDKKLYLDVGGPKGETGAPA